MLALQTSRKSLHSEKKLQSNEPQTTRVTLIELKRANNVEIALARLRLSDAQIRERIEDPSISENPLDAEQEARDQRMS